MRSSLLTWSLICTAATKCRTQGLRESLAVRLKSHVLHWSTEKNIEMPYRQKWLFLMFFFGWRIRFWHPFSPIWSGFSCTGSSHFPFVIENRKFIFWNQLAIVMVLIIFYVFLGAESVSGIHFYPSCLDLAVPEVAIFPL